MTKEEAKHLSEVLKAYSEGKKIEVSLKGKNLWIEDSYDLNFDFYTYEYRIMKEPKLRPYANAEEFLKAQREHGNALYNKVNNEYHTPTQISKGGINVMYENNSIYHTFDKLLHSEYNYVWQDGHPMGILE